MKKNKINEITNILKLKITPKIRFTIGDILELLKVKGFNLVSLIEMIDKVQTLNYVLKFESLDTDTFRFYIVDNKNIVIAEIYYHLHLQEFNYDYRTRTSPKGLNDILDELKKHRFPMDSYNQD